MDYAVMEYRKEFQSSDPDELFCMSLAAHLKKLLPRDRNTAKLRMLQILHDSMFGDSIASEVQNQ